MHSHVPCLNSRQQRSALPATCAERTYSTHSTHSHMVSELDLLVKDQAHLLSSPVFQKLCGVWCSGRNVGHLSCSSTYDTRDHCQGPFPMPLHASPSLIFRAFSSFDFILQSRRMQGALPMHPSSPVASAYLAKFFLSH